MPSTPSAPSDEADPSSPSSQPPSLPDLPVPPALKTLPTPPTKADIFSLATSTPLAPHAGAEDPRVSLRTAPASPPLTPISLPPSPDQPHPDASTEPQSLAEYRKREGAVKRLSRLRSLFDSIPAPSASPSPPSNSIPLPPTSPSTSSSPSPPPPTTAESQARDRRAYTSELWRQCGASVAASVPPVPSSPSSSSAPLPSPSSSSPPASSSPSPSLDAERQSALRALRWTAFQSYADEKEAELWSSFCALDQDGDHRIGVGEVREACRRAGIELPKGEEGERSVREFVRHVDRDGDGVISFDEWRDFLLLLPRPSTMKEIWRFYQTHRLDRPSMSRLTQDGDVVVGRGKTGWNKLLGRPGTLAAAERAAATAQRKEERAAAQAVVEGTDLRRMEAEREGRENGERAYVEGRERERRERERREEGRRAVAQAQEVEGGPGGTVGASTLQFEESGVVVASSSASSSSSSSGEAKGAAKEAKGGEEKRVGEAEQHDGEEEEEEEHDAMTGMFEGAGKFLLAGGMAGAVSRTATAPFDRLKVYLITSPSAPAPPPPSTAPPIEPLPPGTKPPKRPRPGAGSLVNAIRAVYGQGGGIKAFWTGNGLNIVKIFPESAIKFLSYESAKRVFAQYWDRVPDQTLISNSSRFVAGGIGGVVSQFCIYPIESLKTRVMSSSGSSSARGNALIVQTARDMFSRGGLRFFFRGLPAGLIGVFPYSAIDMSTFEGIKLAYTKWAGEEPGIAGSLCFGAISGGVGATSVYPLNLVRTRLQAQGTPAHPQTYTGIRDAALKCYMREGWRGFYKGLTPTLVKVVPAVAISYAVYDTSKKMLFAPEEPVDTHSECEEES
ncbi:hypothetical protein JCM6882_007702 [Rhodosporidiobolus microsporus]